MSAGSERHLPATPKKLERARAAGDVARSAFAPAIFAWIALPLPLMVLWGCAQWWLRWFAEDVGQWRDSARDAAIGLNHMRWIEPAPIWQPILLGSLGACVAAVASAAACGALAPSWRAAGPKLSRFSPLAATRSAFSAAHVRSALLALAAIAACAISAVDPLRSLITGAASALSFADQLALTKTVLAQFWLRSSAALLVLAVLDIALARRAHAMRLRMSTLEVREERKRHEGNPEWKARRRLVSFQRRRLRIAALKKATAVVTNPDHVAVALRYAPPAIDIPVVVCAGADAAAAAVRSAAHEHGVPIVESPDLARALYACVGVDEPIPEDLYAAVAALFAFILRRYGTLRGKD
jgi:flagellar biosynthetic protein FlhB